MRSGDVHVHMCKCVMGQRPLKPVGARGNEGGMVGGCMAPLQVECDPLRVRGQSGGTRGDAFFEDMVYSGHLE